MFKMLASAAVAGLISACAAPLPDVPGAASDPLRPARGSTASGAATAAALGFHGPVYRAYKPEAPD